MRPRLCGLCILALAVAAFALAQSTTTTYTPDLLNGGFIPLTTTDASDHTQTQVTQSLNGRQVPLEQHEERVLSRGADGSMTTESIVRKYDPTGQLGSTERIVTELHPTPGGGSVVSSTTYRTNINGDSQPVEHRTVDTRVSGSTTAVNTVVERPNVDGSLQTAEKSSEVTESTDSKKTTTESVYRRDSNDGFSEAERKVTTQASSGGQTVVSTTLYQPGGTAGALQFQEQRVATTTSNPDGTQVSRVDVYGPAADGEAQDRRRRAPAQAGADRLPGETGGRLRRRNLQRPRDQRLRAFTARPAAGNHSDRVYRQLRRVRGAGGCPTTRPRCEALDRNSRQKAFAVLDPGPEILGDRLPQVR